jgi:hypothetical protein
MKNMVIFILAGIASFCLSFNVFLGIDLSIRRNMQHPQVVPGNMHNTAIAVRGFGASSRPEDTLDVLNEDESKGDRKKAGSPFRGPMRIRVSQLSGVAIIYFPAEGGRHLFSMR